ncbi:sulfotransferase family 2 domain-containing protein [Shimia sp. MIT1388]|uniref:sulfotransferase family 2 domain-containing protein n=1 Tax=Shimia sp. MIT1388 TaxID=3096992 RepID=UPI003999DACF
MRLIFAHIPKAAGTSARLNLQRQMAPEGIKCIEAYRLYGVTPENFPEYKMPEDWQFLCSHVPVSILTDNPQVAAAQDVLMLSFVRDPIDRLISMYNYVSLNPKHPGHAKMRDRDGVKYVTSVVANEQCRFLRPKHDVAPKWQYMISAVDNVEETSRAVLQRMVNRTVPAKVFAKKRNTTQERQSENSDFKTLSKTDFSEETLSELRDKHAEDFKLYNRAKKKGFIEHLPIRLLSKSA